MATYTTYEAKAKFSEVLRRVRAGERVIISYHGDEVAEMRPLTPPGNEAAALRRLEERGALAAAQAPGGELRPLARRRGALARFLADRE